MTFRVYGFLAKVVRRYYIDGFLVQVGDIVYVYCDEGDVDHYTVNGHKIPRNVIEPVND